MAPAGRVVQSADFVPGESGPRFRLVSEPADGAVRGTVVFVPAFAEEMNKSRRMVARMARLLAADGWRVVQRDLFGCGDSAGDFGDATWAHWLHDLDDELAPLDEGQPAWLWCQRAGALLVSAALARHASLNLLLWQPVVSGSQHLQQFLRLHAGARIVGNAAAGGAPSPLQTLRGGTSVEVGGYQLHPGLAAGMDKATFDPPASWSGRAVWLEVSGDDVPELSPQGARAVDALRARGVGVVAEAVGGPPFWQTQEIEECQALLDLSLAALRAGPETTAPADRTVSAGAAP